MLRLLHVQIGNFLAGKTTNERFGRAFIAHNQDDTLSPDEGDYESSHQISAGEIYTDNA